MAPCTLPRLSLLSSLLINVIPLQVLDMTTEELRNRFMTGVRNVAAVSLAIKYPTLASAPHSLANGLQNMLAIAAASDVTFSV